MAIKKVGGQAKLYAPKTGQNTKPVGHKKVVGQGSVAVKKTQRVNPAQYGGEDSVKPASATSGTWKKTGTDAAGHSQYAFQDDAMFKTGRVKPKKPGKGGKAGAGGYGHR